MMTIPFYQPSITEAEIDEVIDTLRGGWLSTGPKTKRFESEFAAYMRHCYAVAVNSCTAALHLALEAVGLKAGQTVLLLRLDAFAPHVLSTIPNLARFKLNSGGVIIERHPLLGAFPHQGVEQGQLYDLLLGGQALDCHRVSLDFEPVMVHYQARDETKKDLVKDLPVTISRGLSINAGWYQAGKFCAPLFQVKVGDGLLVGSGLNLLGNGSPQAVWLLDQLVRYSAGKEKPCKVTISADDLAKALAVRR